MRPWRRFSGWFAARQQSLSGRWLAVLIAATPVTAVAESCLPFLSGETAARAELTLVTLDRNGVASYVPMTRIEHLPPLKVPSSTMNPVGGRDPELYKTYTSAAAPTPQFFSDRIAGTQPFDIAQGDVVALSLTVEASPKVVLAFVSHGLAKTTFRASCASSGVLHGTTKSTDFLLLLKHPTAS